MITNARKDYYVAVSTCCALMRSNQPDESVVVGSKTVEIEILD